MSTHREIEEMKYSHAIAHLAIMHGLEEEHVEKLKKREKKSKAVMERIEESKSYLPELFSAIKVLLRESGHSIKEEVNEYTQGNRRSISKRDNEETKND